MKVRGNHRQQETGGTSRRKQKTGLLPTYNVLSVLCEHAIEPGQVNSGLRHQGSKPSHEIQQLEDDVGSAISIRRL